MFGVKIWLKKLMAKFPELGNSIHIINNNTYISETFSRKISKPVHKE